ncbi:hypothetical protein QBC38DRAFT_485252 [Podospora fimiseda]|uniref:Fucose-specific lectin n=1 Tax=Podospora fimiseda TaxID=252190 RepID=A0AAN7BJU9_9PEZI|nr:hypothetical protein QBC38DRAFT_485252 [Podospora fimiseda]
MPITRCWNEYATPLSGVGSVRIPPPTMPSPPTAQNVRDFEADTDKIVHHHGHSTKEVVPHDIYPEVVFFSGLEVSKSYKEADTSTATSEKKPGWSKRQKLLVIGWVFLLMIVIFLGTAFGLTLSQSSSSDNDHNNNNNKTSPGKDTSNNIPNTTTITNGGEKEQPSPQPQPQPQQIFCPNSSPSQQIARQVLSFSSLPSTNTNLIFARTADFTISYFSLSSQTWTCLSHSTTFLSPPTTIPWNQISLLSSSPTQISVFAISSFNQSVLTTNLPSSSSSFNQWQQLGSFSSSSPVSLSSFPISQLRPNQPQRIEQYILSPSHKNDILHNLYDPTISSYMLEFESRLLSPSDNPISFSSTPASISWSRNPIHTILLFSSESMLQARYYFESEGGYWSPWISASETRMWKGDPVSINVSEGEYHFLEVGLDYNNIWGYV